MAEVKFNCNLIAMTIDISLTMSNNDRWPRSDN